MFKIKSFIIKHKNEIIFVLIFLILIILISLKFIIISSISLVQFLAGVGGFLTIYIYFQRDSKTQTQLELTRKQIEENKLQATNQFEQTKIQIENQEITRKDQQFLDAIKLIEENKYDKNHNLNDIFNFRKELAGLKILENLAKLDINYRQRVLDYLGIQTERLREIINNMKIETTVDFISSENFIELGFKKFSIEFDNSPYRGVEPNKVLINGLSHNFKKNIKSQGIEIIFDFYNQEFVKDKFGYGIVDNQDYPIDTENSKMNIKLIDANRETLRLNFFNYLEKNNLKFEKSCLSLAEKILGMHSKESYNLIISEIFLPFLNINRNAMETNLVLFAQNEFNIVGLAYQRMSAKNTIIYNESIMPNHSVLINCNRLYSHRDSVSYCTISNSISSKQNSIQLPRAFTNSTLRGLLIDYSSTIKSIGDLFSFYKCFFSSVSFLGTNKCWSNYNRNEEVTNFPKFSFINCEFSDNIKFQDIEVQEIYFKDCKTSKKYPIIGLETVTILSENKEELNEMVEDLKSLIKDNIKIGIPKFKHSELILKELKEIEKIRNKKILKNK